MKSTLILAGTLAMAAALFAQQGGPGRRGHAQAPQGGQPALDIARQFVVEGPVTAVHIGLGAQYPSIEINGKQIKTAPVWFLLENDFEIKAGDVLRVIAAPGTKPEDAYVYALSIANTKTKAEIALRDAQGYPEWAGGRGGRGIREGRGNGNRRGNGAGCIDPATLKTYTGVVEKVTFGVGIEMPVLVIKSGSELISFRIGPERILLENDFELKPGETVTVVAVYSPCCETNVAISITNSAGQTVVLREDDGTPAW